MDGCHITYITHCDPRGKLPTWLVNRLTKVIAPKIIRKLHKACKAYPEWKKLNQPHWKPWMFAEQKINFPRIDLAKCQHQEYHQEIIDESQVSVVSDKNTEN